MRESIPSDFQVPGFLAAGISAGIKKKQEKDLALIFSEIPAVSAGVFTQNQVKAAPVLLTRERIKSGLSQAILMNSGCANACTGKRGLQDARRLAQIVASSLKISPKSVLLASTGVIGMPLPMPTIERNLPLLVDSLSSQGLGDTAQAILTTDTHPKALIHKSQINGREIVVAGLAKGAGMINPRMATLLSFVLTDAVISSRALKQALKMGVAHSFNRITVDGDTSTNDTLLILANGRAQNRKILPQTPGFNLFCSILQELLSSLAKMIVQDGEGATKLVEIRVAGARTVAEAEKVARSIANSPLVKTAFFGQDPNWGRILCAAGYSGVPLNADKVDIDFDDEPIVCRGQGVGGLQEKRAGAVMKKKEYSVRLHLHRGSKQSSVFTTDFSFDYIKINASYRS